MNLSTGVYGGSPFLQMLLFDSNRAAKVFDFFSDRPCAFLCLILIYLRFYALLSGLCELDRDRAFQARVLLASTAICELGSTLGRFGSNQRF